MIKTGRLFALLAATFVTSTASAHDATYYNHYTNASAQLSLTLNPNQAVYWSGATLNMQINAYGYIVGRNGGWISGSLPVNCYIDNQPVSTISAPWMPYSTPPVTSLVPVLGLGEGPHSVKVEHTNSWEYFTETIYAYTSTHKSWIYTYYHTYMNVYHYQTIPCSASRAFTVLPSTNFHKLQVSTRVQPTMLLNESFDGASGSALNPALFSCSGEVVLDGSSRAALQTWSCNESSLRSVATATAENQITLKFRASAYAEGSTIYGDGQPRGLRVGTDPNNVIEFYSASGTLAGIRTRKNGAESSGSAPVPAGVDAFHDYELKVSSGSAIFSIDGTPVGTITSNVPSGQLNFYISTFDGYAGNVPAAVDSVELSASNYGPPALDIRYTGIPTNTYWLYWTSDFSNWNLHSSSKSSTNGTALWSEGMYPGQRFYRVFGP